MSKRSSMNMINPRKSMDLRINSNTKRISLAKGLNLFTPYRSGLNKERLSQMDKEHPLAFSRADS
jgi:hypothetical protein